MLQQLCTFVPTFQADGLSVSAMTDIVMKTLKKEQEPQGTGPVENSPSVPTFKYTSRVPKR
jgi:hypothetical protein